MPSRLPVAAAATIILAVIASRGFAQPTSQPVAAPTPTFNDPNLPADAKDVTITSGFDGTWADVAIERRSASHYVVRSTAVNKSNGQYFLIHLEGVAHRTVQVDFAGEPFSRWGNAIPMFSTVADLDAPDGFDVSTPDAPEAETKERAVTDTTPALPDTSKQGWHYASTVSHDGELISMRHAFDDHDAAYVSFKLPFTPGYGREFLDLIHDNPALKLVEVGKSAKGEPLQVAVVAKDAVAGSAPRPCVLIYAREGPDDQDGSWIAQGALFALTADTPEAAALREACDVIVIPMLDPDGAASGARHNVGTSFIDGGGSPEAKAYMTWFDGWIAGGRRLDVAISLNSSIPGSNFHVASPLMEPETTRLAACMALHKQIRDALLEQGFAVRSSPWSKGMSGPTLSGWLQAKYGTLVLPYVTTSLQAKAQLNLAQLRQLGGTIVKGSAAFVGSVDGQSLMKQIDATRVSGPATTQPK